MNPLASWTTACAHINGLALGSTIVALWQRGTLSHLAQPSGYRPDPEGSGTVVGALRLLELLGWVRRAEPGVFHLTGRGQAAASLVPAFVVVPRLLREARHLLEGAPLESPASPELLDLVTQCQARWGLAPTPTEAPADLVSWFILALDGHLAGPVVSLVQALGGPAAVESRPVRSGSVLDTIGRILLTLGWARAVGHERGIRFTPEGLVALGMAGTYGHTVAYLPMLERVPAALSGEIPLRAVGADQPEIHVDRTRDVAVSGEVFSKFVAVPFLEVFLPLFEVASLEDQPRAIVDVGCGDASMLVALCEAVRSRTLRGRHLDAFPLEAIGVDYNEAARCAAVRTLRNASLPHRVLAGDINDPARLARDLDEMGISPHDCAWVCKSVIHNRPFVPPARHGDGDAASIGTRGTLQGGALVHVTPSGRLIPAGQVEQNLVEFFERWIPLASPHGWVVAEAHAVDPATVVAHLPRTLAPALEATHVYSCQLLVEMPTYHRAAEQAGFVSRSRRTLGRAVLGHDYMSIDHFVSGP